MLNFICKLFFNIYYNMYAILIPRLTLPNYFYFLEANTISILFQNLIIVGMYEYIIGGHFSFQYIYLRVVKDILSNCLLLLLL